MKKIVFALATALLLGAGTMSAQNKFKAVQKRSTAKTTKVAQADKASKVAPIKAAVKATAATGVKPKATTSKSSDPTFYNGIWANSYSDGIGGMVTDYLELTFDTTTGIAKGIYKDENGDGRAVNGKLVGNKLVLTYDADGDEFATVNIINENTIKLEGFTGTFKRVQDMDSAPKVDIAIPVDQAPVDPALEDVKKYLEDK